MKRQSAPVQPSIPARESLFDSGWLFSRGDAIGADRPAFDDTTWRTLDLPHDWSIEDLPEIPVSSAVVVPVLAGAWRFKKGDDASWADPAFADSGWQKIELVDSFDSKTNSSEDIPYLWFRRRVNIPAAAKKQGAIIFVTGVKDVGEVFLNGKRVGITGSFPPDYQGAVLKSRLYPVAGDLIKGDGTDVIAVRVFNGPGNPCANLPEPVPPVRSGPFDTNESPGQRHSGYVVGGTAWYRKHFTLPQSSSGKKAFIRFDGVYMDADVWLNGRHLGNHPYGYTSFEYDLTPHLNPAGQDNVIAVRVRNEESNSRWYTGSGIYRHTWLTLTDPLHVPLWGISVTTPQVSSAAAVVNVAATIENGHDHAVEAAISVRIIDADGGSVGEKTTLLSIPAFARIDSTCAIKLQKPALWSLEKPMLYQAAVAISQGDAIADASAVAFGIRNIEITAKKGFLLNGVPLKLKGGCIHHDNGPLGAVAIDRAEVRKIEVMKANGFNAIRCAHNPPSPAFLDACDRIGMIVMDEAFDIWRYARGAGELSDYHRFFQSWWARDLDSMVYRDRNHPCVAFWSIGNEIPNVAKPEVYKIARTLSDYVKALDPTRPVTSAVASYEPWDTADNFFATVDICGYNYKVDRFAHDGKRIPGRIIISTESTPPNRFEYWMGVMDNPHVLGDFLWTGMDYFGESGVGAVELHEGKRIWDYYAWPYHGAPCGDLDVCGFRRPQIMYRDVLWELSDLEIAVRKPIPQGRLEQLCPWGWPEEEASWSWPGSEGRQMKIMVYSRCDSVTLLLNGKEVGSKKVSRATRFTAEFMVPYEPGELQVHGFVKGKKTNARVLRTTGAPAKIRLTADRGAMRADRNDLSYVTVEAEDASGNPVPYADAAIQFTVSGQGELAAVGNGNLKDSSSYRQPLRNLYRGKALAILRPLGSPGTVVLKATAAGLKAAEVRIAIQ